METMNSQVILIIAAIATVYIVLGILYESYVHPLTILSTPAPRRALERCWRWSCSMPPFSLIALIGIMLLIGIVKKNAIMMVDFALEAQRHGNLTPQEAIFRALSAAFSPDYDDHPGGAVWCAAAGIVGRRRLGAAATPWGSPLSADW